MHRIDMSLNVRHTMHVLQIRKSVCSIMFLKKYTKINCITVKISHIICLYLYMHKKAAEAAKNRLLELNSTTFFLELNSKNFNA